MWRQEIPNCETATFDAELGDADASKTVPHARREKCAGVLYQRAVLGHDWQPLQTTTLVRSGPSVVVNFNLPVPTLNWELIHGCFSEWVNGRGFKPKSSSNNITVSSVEISGGSVAVTADSDLPRTAVLVDPLVGYTFGQHNPNYTMSFEVSVP